MGWASVLLLSAAFLFGGCAWAADELTSTRGSARVESAPKSGFGTRSVGHLVTSNTEVLARHEIALGTLYAGLGLTDHWTVGVSPFVYVGYDMHNLMARGAWAISARERVSVDAAYFKTYGVVTPAKDAFEMEAWNVKITYNRKFAPWYRLNLMTGYYYYINDEMPFSLRMDPANGARDALVFTTLQEIRLAPGNIYLGLEAGVWGANYQYPYAHLGATVGLQNSRFLMSAGLSTTVSPGFPSERAKIFAGYDSRAAVHPELQIEVFL